MGHEDWVHSVAWQPLGPSSKAGAGAGAEVGAEAGVEGGIGTGSGAEAGVGSSAAPDRRALCLLTASMDRTMMLWTYEVGRSKGRGVEE